MSLSTFLDLVWTEIYDDCSPMGDRAQYRQIIGELFLQGKDPQDIWYVDHDGKKKRLAESSDRRSGPVPLDAKEALRRLQAQARAAREQAGLDQVD